jgi:anthranilate phosphoribosyltransferase
MSLKASIEKCLSGEALTADEASSALEIIMTGQATEAQVAGLLIALRAKGETVDELIGFARTMRRHAVRIHPADPDAIDMCGTGGDGASTFNISTVATLVAAGAGVTVAKHGNKAVSSASGSADVLQALGVKIGIPPERVEACVNTVGVGFLFAPLFHPAMKHAAKARTDLGVRTIFNMLGPITNPAGVRRQLIGTYQGRVAARLAEALTGLDTGHACVIYSENGMDEVSLSGHTEVYEVTTTEPVASYAVSASDFGLSQVNGDSMKGGDSRENAVTTLKILRGEKSSRRDVVVANAAFGIYVSGRSRSLSDGSRLAEESIDSGRALKTLEDLIEFTNRP